MLLDRLGKHYIVIFHNIPFIIMLIYILLLCKLELQDIIKLLIIILGDKQIELAYLIIQAYINIIYILTN